MFRAITSAVAAISALASSTAALASRAIQGMTCGTLISPSQQYRASFTLQTALSGERTMTVWLCDQLYRCHHALVAPASANATIEWRADETLVIRSSAAGRTEPRPREVTAWPRVRLEALEAQQQGRSSQLAFDPSLCRVLPPVVSRIG